MPVESTTLQCQYSLTMREPPMDGIGANPVTGTNANMMELGDIADLNSVDQ